MIQKSNMNRIIRYVMFVLVVFLALPGSMIFAASDTELLSDQIRILNEQIEILNLQIRDTSSVGARLYRAPHKVSVETKTISKYLYTGMSDPEVEELQRILAMDADLYPEGLITGYYGVLTEAAVKRFQVRWGIESVGVVGPITRQKIHALHESDLPYDISKENIEAIISASLQWFKNAQEETGHFKYEYHPFSGVYSEDDHIVRQAGALYALGEIIKRSEQDVYDIKSMVQKAAAYMRDNSYEGEYEGEKFSCLLISSKRCTLGGTALALVGMIDLVIHDPSLDAEYAEIIKGYTDFVLLTKKPDEGFRNYHYINRPQTATESTFSNGEALLALARAHLYQPHPEIQTVMDEAFNYFQKAEVWDPNLYLWAMAAIKDLYTLDGRNEYVEYVKEYTDYRVGTQQVRKKSSRNRCAYIEGVISAYSVIQPNVTKTEQMTYEKEIGYWLDKSARLQITSDDTAHLGESIYDLEDEKVAFGGFVTAQDVLLQRIDFTQHCLNSFVQYRYDILQD